LERHYGLDWLRIGAFGLLILYHIGMFFVPWDWHVKTAAPIDLLCIPMLATNSWRIPLLFVVSGYATRAVLQKAASKGGFARDRTARLLIPTIAAMILIIPPQPWIELVFKHGYAESFPHFWARDYFRFEEQNGIVVPTWQHLWFVVYLWAYTMALAPAAALFGRWSAIGAWLDRRLAGAWLYLVPIGWLLAGALILFPETESTHALVDDPQGHWVFLPHFLFGLLLAGAPRIWETIRASWRVALVIAVVAYLIVAVMEYFYPGNAPLPESWVAPRTAARIVQGWCAVVALLGIADRFWNRDHPWRATLTEAVFPFYIVHQTIIVVTGWWLLRFGLPPVVEFAILLAATVTSCWLFYDLGRRIGLLRPLIGLRTR
jgi:glucans biosynthesis protein C